MPWYIQSQNGDPYQQFFLAVRHQLETLNLRFQTIPLKKLGKVIRIANIGWCVHVPQCGPVLTVFCPVVRQIPDNSTEICAESHWNN